MTTETALDPASAERTRRTLGPKDEGRRLTSQEFQSAGFTEPYRYERVDGRLVVMPPDGEDHSIASHSWCMPLYHYNFNHREIVSLISTPCWIRMDDQTDRIADFGIYLRRNVGPPEPPDLVFEVVSPGRVNRERDYVRKKAEYHRIGIREYVIIDRFQRSATVCRLEPGTDSYQERVLTEADVYETPLLPGFALPVAEAFRD